MTHSGGKPHTNVGDRGQRYEITFEESVGIRRVMGWADSMDGVERFKRSIELHPSWAKPEFRDRFIDEEEL